MTPQDVIGRFFLLRSETECQENEHLRWTLYSLPKGFPLGHPFSASDCKSDVKGRLWALLGSVTKTIGPELDSWFAEPIWPYDNSKMREAERHDRVLFLKQDRTLVDPEKPFRFVSYLRMDNAFWVPVDRLKPILFKDGSPVCLEDNCLQKWREFQHDNNIVQKSKKDLLWSVNKDLMDPKEKYKGNTKDQKVYFIPQK